jgi:2-succinyl-6-hydroxy-2,4-cyclohexadiene-1-carboxylate synthase
LTGLVLIHGFTGSPASFDGLSRRLARRSPRVSVHRPALLGHGGAAPPDTVRFEQEVDRIAHGIVRAGASGSHLCGYSLGARIALGLLARHGYLFAGATLIGVHPGLSNLAERAARVGSDERWCELLSRRGVGAFLDAWQAQPLLATQRALPAAEAVEQRRIRSSHSARGLMHALRVLGLGQMPNYHSALGSARCRLRLVAGERDDKFVALARTMAGRTPSIEIDVVPDVGHNVLLEAPDHVERSLLRELARAGAVRREELEHEN